MRYTTSNNLYLYCIYIILFKFESHINPDIKSINLFNVCIIYFMCQELSGSQSRTIKAATVHQSDYWPRG